MPTITLTSRVNARGRRMYYVEGRQRGFATPLQARQAAREVARFERVAAVFPQARDRDLARTCIVSPFSDAFPLGRAADDRGITLPAFHIVEDASFSAA